MLNVNSPESQVVSIAPSLTDRTPSQGIAFQLTIVARIRAGQAGEARQAGDTCGTICWVQLAFDEVTSLVVALEKINDAENAVDNDLFVLDLHLVYGNRPGKIGKEIA